MSDPLVGFEMGLELSGAALIAMAGTGFPPLPYVVGPNSADPTQSQFVVNSLTLDFAGDPDAVMTTIGSGELMLTAGITCGTGMRSDGQPTGEFAATFVVTGIRATVQVGGTNPFDNTAIDPATRTWIFVDFRHVDATVLDITTVASADQETVDLVAIGFAAYLTTYQFPSQSIAGTIAVDPGIVVDPTQDGAPNQIVDPDCVSRFHFTQLVALFAGRLVRQPGTPTSLCLLIMVTTEGAALGAQLLANGTAASRPPQLAGSDFNSYLGPNVFKTSFFCPALAAWLSEGPSSLPVSALPTSCGLAQSIHNSVSWMIVNFAAGNGTGAEKEFLKTCSGIDWSQIDGSLADGFIAVHLMGSVNGPCYSAEPDISCNLLPQVDENNNLILAGSVGALDLNVTIPWWCYFIAAADLWGLPGIIAAGAVQALGELVGNALANHFASLKLQNGIYGGSAPGLPYRLTISTFSVSSAALTITATLPVTPRASGGSLTVSPVTVSTGSTETATGEFTSTECPLGTFPYTLSFTPSQISMTPSGSGVFCPPISDVGWLVTPGGGGTRIIEGASGQLGFYGPIDVPDLMLGSVMTTGDITIDYTFDGTTLTLINSLPSNGTFTLTITCAAFDNHGDTLWGQFQIEFLGPTVDAPEYLTAFGNCEAIEALLELIAELEDPQTEPSLATFAATEDEQRTRLVRAALLKPNAARGYRAARNRLTGPPPVSREHLEQRFRKR